jgi:hypothetical protein
MLVLGLRERAETAGLTLAMIRDRLLEPSAGLRHSSIVSAGASEHPADGAGGIRREPIPVRRQLDAAQGSRVEVWDVRNELQLLEAKRPEREDARQHPV